MEFTVDHRTVRALLEHGRAAIGSSQRELAQIMGSSYRTVQRMQAGQSDPSEAQMARLAAAVHPRDPKIAAQIAAAVGETLESLGIVARPSPPPASNGPALPPEDLVPLLAEAVVAAAAEVLGISPATMRPALVAALERAVRARLSVEAMHGALTAARAYRRSSAAPAKSPARHAAPTASE